MLLSFSCDELHPNLAMGTWAYATAGRPWSLVNVCELEYVRVGLFAGYPMLMIIIDHLVNQIDQHLTIFNIINSLTKFSTPVSADTAVNDGRQLEAGLRQASAMLLVPGPSFPGFQVPWLELNDQIHPLQPVSRIPGSPWIAMLQMDVGVLDD